LRGSYDAWADGGLRYSGAIMLALLRAATRWTTLSLALAGCATPAVVGQTPGRAPIVEIPLRMSNAYLLESSTPVLVDAGTVGDMDDLRHDLFELGLRPAAIRLVIVTHAHHDHAGLASDLQALGAKVMLGEGDVAQARRGEDDDLKATGLTGSLLKPLLPKLFPAFEPDIVVREPTSLKDWGVDGAVLPMPGHTPGSLVVLLANHAAFVGDEMLGGYLAGMLFPDRPGEHYYQADPAANRRNIAALLSMGVETFYLGHGGPVSAPDVARVFGRAAAQ
jgi:glyoxylase-like metal-dependent hydrolase (beta-lactamase superfamily II)